MLGLIRKTSHDLQSEFPDKKGFSVRNLKYMRQLGYPPDMQLLATETVLKQAEMIASELAG
jgi:hypothetical protein